MGVQRSLCTHQDSVLLHPGCNKLDSPPSNFSFAMTAIQDELNSIKVASTKAASYKDHPPSRQLFGFRTDVSLWLTSCDLKYLTCTFTDGEV